jgi:cysteine desulfurase
MGVIYMDYNATTPADPRVVEAMLPYFTERFGNPSSPYGLAHKSRAAVERAREQMASGLGCRSSEVVFTSGGSESDNSAIKGVAFAHLPERGHIITSAIEHHAVLLTCEYLEKEFGFSVTYLPVDADGLVDAKDVRRAVRDDTWLISVMYVNNEVGTIQPLKEIADIAREHGITFHTDAVQAIGKIPVDVDALGVDLLSLSAHKLYGPKGVGALYVRAGTRMHPLVHGGSHERGMRAGTENVPGIVGLGKAVELAVDEMEIETARLTPLRDRLEKTLLSEISGVALNGHREKRIPSTANLSFLFVEGESIVLSLDMEGVAVSTGSACTTDAAGPSHVLAAMGIKPNVAQGSVRFGLGRHTREADVDRVLSLMPGIVERLRAISPLRDRA